MKLSKQRQAVLDVVNNSCDHPTAETILFRCKDLVPTINLATVYRNLACLVELGLIKKISQEGGDRYDKTLIKHAHFKCCNCGCLTDVNDVDFNSIISNIEEKFAFKIDDTNLLFSGKCEKCLRSF